jgi:murein DD-endopeptidase MepM/ murein hydrolase activator NlpD
VKNARTRVIGGKEHRIIDRSSNAVRVTGRPIRFLAGVAVAFTVVIGAPAAFGVGGPSQLPVVDPGVPPADAGVAPAPVTTAPAATTPPAAAAPGTTGSLAPGAGGADVKALQRKLRVRGIRVPVDGSYGRQTRAGVRILQRKLRLPVTGIADAKLLSKLGLKIRAVASVPVATPAAPAAAQYLKAFPVIGTHSYENDFGDARSQGSHEGNDIMSPRGTPVVAVADGTIKRLTRVETGLGGVWIWLMDTAGNEYYYAHLNDIVAGLDAGSKVTAGQQIGTVGNTGDARFGAAHLHFEVHPGGGGAINPYTDLVAVDPNRGKN